MEQVREALRSYVADGAPPLGLTREGVLRAGRRSRRNRRLAAAGGVAFALALVTAAGVAFGPVALDRYRRTGPADGFAAARPCDTWPGTRPATPAPLRPDQPLPADLAAWATATVTCQLADALPRMVPGARFARVPGESHGPLQAFIRGGPLASRVDALALVGDDKGVGDLTVQIGVSLPDEAAEEARNCDSRHNCTVRTGPNGETVLISPQWPGTPGYHLVAARVYRGQTSVVVEATDSDRQMVNGGAPKPTRTEPVLTIDQAVELALSPELLLFP